MLSNPNTRRNFLSSATTLVGAGLASSLLPRAAMAFPAMDPPPSPLVARVVKSPQNTYFTYPHSNGYLPDGTVVFASPTGGNGTDIDYIGFNPDKPGSARRLASVKQARMYYSISAHGLMVIGRADGTAAVLDLTSASGSGNVTPHQFFHQEGATVTADNDISADGKRALITSVTYDQAKQPTDGGMMIVDIATGSTKSVVNHWQVDHGHFSPYDQSWVCFADNRPNNDDRMWVWNEAQAPKGRHIFDQNSPKGQFKVGHERAMFNKRALLTVAYYAGEHGGQPGLYEVAFDGTVRLVSAGKRDFHCNISRDGTWAVVSLQGTYDPADTKPNGNWLQVLGTGYGYSDVMIVNMRTGAREFLYRGTNATNHQPYEVQPTISPDGRWVLLKDAREQRVLMVEINQDALRSFLSS